MAIERVGTGARFRSLTAKLAQTPGVRNPAALAAYAGRKKYGNKRFAALAAAGAKRARAGGSKSAPKPRLKPRVRV
jgi:hypothetical protein